VANAPKHPGGGWWRSARKSGEGRASRGAASAAPGTPTAAMALPAAVRPAAAAAPPSSAYCGENACAWASAIDCCCAVPLLGAAECGRGSSTAAGCSIDELL
jgi:hypothetical protein